MDGYQRHITYMLSGKMHYHI